MKLSGLLISWILFIALALIWGSSFILMKLGMETFSPIQVASIRIIAAAVVFLPVAVKAFKRLTNAQLGYAIASGLLGSFFPAYLFCIAETKIDSAMAGMLNALTPVFVIIIGVSFYKLTISRIKIFGVFIALAGCVLLLMAQSGFTHIEDPLFAGMIVLATVLYGWNVNLVKKHLSHLYSIDVVAVALVSCSIPSLIILILFGFPSFSFDKAFLISFASSIVLGVAGTAIATILFYKLIRKAGVVFSSMVTYAIPVVAIMWGVVFREVVGWVTLMCLFIILTGVYLVNRNRSVN